MDKNKEYYAYNITTLKRYGNNFIKLQTQNVQRVAGYQSGEKEVNAIVKTLCDSDNFKRSVLALSDSDEKLLFNNALSFDEYFSTKNKCDDDNTEKERLLESIIRTKRNIFEYAMSNDFDYFATFTIDPAKCDRYNLNEYHKKFSQWIRNNYRKKNVNIQYLCIPEEHKDGAWHEHALIRGLPLSELRQFSISDKIPSRMKNIISSGRKLYDWVAYHEKFGYCSLESVRNAEAVAKYITKYITKDLFKSSIGSGHKLYYVSRGLHKAEKIAVGALRLHNNIDYDFQNQYCRSVMYSYSDEFLETIKSKIEQI